MTFLSKIRSAYRIVSDTEAETRYQYYVDFKGFPSQGKKGKYLQWLFAKKDLKKILDGWDKIAVWIQAGKAAEDTAIVKEQASVPLRGYLEKNPDKEDTNVLYHGIGKDFAGQASLMMKYMDVDVYDPYFKDVNKFKDKHKNVIKELNVPLSKILKEGGDLDKYKTKVETPPEKRGEGKKEYGHIHSHYTLNVVTKEKGKEIIQHIYNLLSDKGKAIISVRRDVDLVGKIDPSIRAKLNN